MIIRDKDYDFQHFVPISLHKLHHKRGTCFKQTNFPLFNYYNCTLLNEIGVEQTIK